MAEHTGISYLDATWNVTTGCTHASPGCDHCWAESMARRKAANPVIRQRADFGEVLTDGRWNGQVRLLENRLDWPLKWKKPKVVGVCFESDLFHEAVPDEFIDKVFAVMALCQQHTFVCLTKRPARMLDWFTNRIALENADVRAAGWAMHLGNMVWDARGSDPNNYWCVKPEQVANRRKWVGWPLPNVWIGVTVENQARADERIPLLLQTPAAHRWVSYEPALAEVDMGQLTWVSLPRVVHGDWPIGHRAIAKAGVHRAYLNPHGAVSVQTTEGLLGIKPAEWDWLRKPDLVVVGCESGPRARPMDLQWAKRAIDQCDAAGVPVYFKQAMVAGKLVHLPEYDGKRYDSLPWRHTGWAS